MAANFGASGTDVEPMGSSASPRAGIVDEPVFIQGVSDVFGQVGDMLKARKEDKNQTAISNFTKQQLLVADGVAQGRYKSAYAQTLLRQNLLNAIDSNAGLTSEFVKAQASIMGLAGGGKIAVDGTEDEQRERARRNQLTTAGLVATDASESEFKRADNAARLAVAAAERHKERTATLQAERDAIATTKARREEIEAQLESENNRMVADSSEAEVLRVRSEFDRILTSGLPESEMEVAINNFYTEWQAQTAAVLGNTKSSTRDVLQGVFNNMKEDYVKRARGEYGDAELTRRLARNEQQRTALLMADPQIAAMATISKVFGSESITQMMVTDPRNDGIDSFMRFIAGGGSKPSVDQPSVFTDDKATKIGMDQYFKDLSRTLTSDDEEAVAEGRDHITSLLTSIEDDSGRIARDPKKAIALVDWLSSPGFLKARNANPEAFANLDGVTSVLNQHYHDEVRGMIDSEFKKNKVFISRRESVRETGKSGNTSIPSDSLVEAVGTDGGMTFQPIDTNNKRAVQEAARLNKVLKPIINNSLKAQAHLEGRTDYKTIWEGASEMIMGTSAGEGTDQLPGGDADDDLTTEDFMAPVAEVRVESLPTPVQQDSQFLQEVGRVSSKHGFAPHDLLAVMHFETGGTFNPAERNKAGSSGTGLIQFMGFTAKELGTTTEALASMNRTEQMQYVDKYFDNKLKGVKNPDVKDLYMSVLWPKAVGKPDDYVLWRKGSKEYGPNAGLDRTGDGTITKAEAAAKVVSFVNRYKA